MHQPPNSNQMARILRGYSREVTNRTFSCMFRPLSEYRPSSAPEPAWELMSGLVLGYSLENGILASLMFPLCEDLLDLYKACCQSQGVHAYVDFSLRDTVDNILLANVFKVRMRYASILSYDSRGLEQPLTFSVICSPLEEIESTPENGP